MNNSPSRSRDKQLLRVEVERAVADLPLAYLVEAVAKRLDVRKGAVSITMHDGALRDVTRFGRRYDVRLPDGRTFPFIGSETFTADRLWDKRPRPARRTGRPVCRIPDIEVDPETPDA